MGKILQTPWCKDCWFLDNTSNLVRCEHHQKLWAARLTPSSPLDTLRRKKKFTITDIITTQVEEDEVVQEPVS